MIIKYETRRCARAVSENFELSHVARVEISYLNGETRLQSQNISFLSTRDKENVKAQVDLSPIGVNAQSDKTSLR